MDDSIRPTNRFQVHCRPRGMLSYTNRALWPTYRIQCDSCSALHFLHLNLHLVANSTLACERVADLFPQLKLGVAEALQPELVPPGGGV